MSDISDKVREEAKLLRCKIIKEIDRAFSVQDKTHAVDVNIENLITEMMLPKENTIAELKKQVERFQKGRSKAVLMEQEHFFMKGKLEDVKEENTRLREALKRLSRMGTDMGDMLHMHMIISSALSEGVSE